MNVQLPPAASDPPVNAIVLVAAVVVNVPPHGDVDESAMDRPAGKTSSRTSDFLALVEHQGVWHHKSRVSPSLVTSIFCGRE